MPVGAAAGQMMVAADIGTSGIGKELYGVGPGGLSLVADLWPTGSSFPREGLAFGGQLLFIADLDSGLEGLFTTNGTTAGTQQLIEMLHKPLSPLALTTALSPSEAVFIGNTQASGTELLHTDGTAVGTQLLVDLDPAVTPLSSTPVALTTVDGQRLFLFAQSGPLGINTAYQWSAAGALDPLTGSGDDLFLPMGVRGTWLTDHEQVLFTATNIGSGTAEAGLYSSDGTLAGTGLLDTFGPNSYLPPPGPAPLLTGDGKQFLFTITDMLHGAEPWITDGSPGGAVLLADLMPGAFGSDPYAGIAFDGGVFFVARNSLSNEALWRVDAGQLSLVANLNPLGSALAAEMTVFGGQLYFSAQDGVHGSELWSSDGTPGGTQMVLDINSGANGSIPASLVPFAGRLYFFARDTFTGGFDLWSTGGSAASTVKVANLNLTNAPRMAQTGTRLWFEANDAAHGDELWSYDGTNLGLVADLTPGPGSSDLGELLAVGQRLYFTASSPSTGTELFVSDGTVLGTQVALDLAGGSASSDPAELTLCKGDIFFIGTDSTGDRELIRLIDPGASVWDLGFGSEGLSLTASPPVLGMPVSASAAPLAPGSAGFMLMSAPTAPTNLLVEPGAASWIDPLSAQVLTIGTTSPLSFGTAVPSTPGLAGLAVHLQAWSLAPAGFPAQVSNGLRLVLGS